ncbi:Superkiller protein 3 [Vanrija pseudolonga]|uniref:Superkiller protein 3 n=1 Tax=Vanrija pseudolonga TaxID=143232 RepID=A0AAF0Y0F3_9TREE|nr:Superkiller protein 3 [Vanrija pseudolonga]
MTSAATKKAIKGIRAKLSDGENEGALYESTQLLKQLGEKDPEAPTVLAYRALALTHLERTDEAEKSYIQALKLQPGHPLATPGLKKLYTSQQKWEDLARLLETAVQTAYDAQVSAVISMRDTEKLTAAFQEVVEFRQKHGPEEALWSTLGLLVPSSPIVPLIMSSLIPAGTYVPLAVPTYPAPANAPPVKLPKPLPHVHHLAGSLTLVLLLLLRTQAQIHSVTEQKVKAGRLRLGAGTERDVRRRVDAEVLGGPLGSTLLSLLRDVAAHPSVDEAVRRDVEVQEFQYWKRLVEVIQPPEKAKPASKASAKTDTKQGAKIAPPASAKLPPKPSMIVGGRPASKDPSPERKPTATGLPVLPLFEDEPVTTVTKEEARQRADGLADGFVLLGVGGTAEEAWTWVLDGRDEPTIFYDIDLLHKFANTFPESTLTDFIDDYCRLFKLPLPKPDDDAAAKEHGEEKNKHKGRRGHKLKTNARARRKQRRMAGQKGELPEDVDEEEREELIASMTKLLARLKQSIFAQRVMARVAITDDDWVNAIAYAEQGRKVVKDVENVRGISLSNTWASLDAALGVALVPYYPPKHHNRATRLLDGVLKNSPGDYEARFAVGQIKETAQDWEGARAEFQTLLDQGGDDKEMVAAREELGWCLVNEGKLEEGRDVLESVVEIRDTRKEQEGKNDEAYPRARAWWRLGRTEWMIGDDESRKNAEQWFMASLRADASFAASYTALGICYAEAHSPPDTERALKCFQKAFELDATEADAARRLAYGYADEDEWAQVRAIATRVMEGEGGVEGVAGGAVVNPTGRFAPKNGWAWKALGSTEMHYKNYYKAIEAYQIALRAEPDDAGMWRMLGDAYVKSGRHLAGLKALEHALDLDPTMWMARYHIGEVHVQLGAYDAAIEAFEAVDAETHGSEVGVTAALAEATLALGRRAAAGGFRERSRAAYYAAIEYALTVLAAARAHRPWGWKLIGDACLQLAEHEADPAEMEKSAVVLQPVLEHLVADDEDRRSAVAGLGHASNLLQTAAGPQYTAKAAVFAMAYRVHLLKNEIRVANSSLYDLACALHELAVNTLVADERTAATKAAVSAIRLALERDAGDERLWNALGVICSAAGKQLAQHCFVVSLECYAKDPVVWTNLGYLYLSLDDRELANECFLKSQTLDPDYARAWFGQGLLAERDGERHQATGLFAHAVTLSAGSLLEADLALAVGSFSRFLAPGQRDTRPLQQPAFALRRYTHSHPRDVAAKHLYALVCERLGLADIAADALETAATLLEEEFETSESAEVESQYAIALCNLGRIDLAAGRYLPALTAFTNCAELAEGSADPQVVGLTVQARLGSALAHFWLGDMDKSLESFQSALDAAKNDPAVTDELVVLLARTLWSVGGEDARDAAKAHLMDLEHPDPSIKVVAALGAVGLASGDPDLVEAATAELNSAPAARRLAQDPEGTADMVQFANAIINIDQEVAVGALEEAAMLNPGAAGPRNRLAIGYIGSGKIQEAKALLRGVREAAVPDAVEATRLRGITNTLDGEEDTVELQKAVLLAPWDTAAWESLAWAKRAVQEVAGEVGAAE